MRGKLFKLGCFALMMLSAVACNDNQVETQPTDIENNVASGILKKAHPRLVINVQDVLDMQAAIKVPGSFQTAYLATKSQVDGQISKPMIVPVPADGGGGYTHEKHKENYLLMLNAGTIYQISKDVKYAHYVRDMLLAYAKIYPTLPLHPKRKANAKNPGKLFWQSLNEAVWLVHTIQAYDLIIPSLTSQQKSNIETGVLRPVATYLSTGSPKTFNKIHNHGTWLTAAVGMTGYVLDEPEWAEQALYGLDKTGNKGLLKQLDKLFSPQGYYNEGPYYQRYALMPFITFAKAIEHNEPERKIFEYRDGIIKKAIDTTIQLSYNKLFFPINDAIKDKGIDTIELVNGVTVAYGLTGDTGLLEIAKIQDQILLTGDGLKIANALDKHLETPYQFESQAFGDGNDGNQGALVIMRQQSNGEDSALLFKPASQGMGHGHFDKLTWQFYDKGQEIVSDYGAARFLNVEAKFGGRYLPENKSYAKHTVAHNTVVVDETTHFNFNGKLANTHSPQLHFFDANESVKISAAAINTAYEGVSLTRTMALVTLPTSQKTFIIDLFDVKSETFHQYDLPLHYKGQLIDTNFALGTNTKSLSALGNNHGYQHLWLKAQAKPSAGIARVTWLNTNGRFYSQSMLIDGNTEMLFTQIGANDPHFNLRNENAYITRTRSKNHSFVSVFEPHGEYNPSKEFTHGALTSVKNITRKSEGDIQIITLELTNGESHLLAFNQQKNSAENIKNTFSYRDQFFEFTGRFKLFENLR